MTPFERATFSPDQVTTDQLKTSGARLPALAAEYATYRTIPTGVEQYDATATLIGFDQVLGGRITRLLMNVDAEAALHMGAQVLSDHARVDRHGPDKDLQVGLMVNVIKEMAITHGNHAAQRYQYAEDIMRRCALDPPFKQRLKEELFDNAALTSSFLVQVSA